MCVRREEGERGVLALLGKGAYLFKGEDLCGKNKIRDESMAGKGVTCMYVCMYLWR